MRVSLRPALLLGTIAATGLLAAGCGGTATDTTGGDGTAPPVAEFVVTGGDDDAKYEAPKEIPGGVVELQLTNDAEGPNSLQLVYADGDYTEKEVFAELGKAIEGEPHAEWLHAGGGIGIVPPGETGSVVQALEPETTYYAIDEETGGEPAPVATFETGADSGAALPEADTTITAADFSFEAEPLKVGENSVRFANEGAEKHHVVTAPLGDSSIEEVVEYFSQEEAEGPPPIEEDENAPSSTVLDGGQEQNLTMNFEEPGRYALLCFITNRDGGPPHVAYGMVGEVEVEE